MSAPEQGWSWMALAASFTIYFFTGGIDRCYGIWYIEILERYEAGPTLSAWIPGVHNAVALMLYPLAALFYNRFSVRSLIIFGSLLYASGLIGCAFTTDIFVVFGSYGVISGLGNCFASFGSQMVVAEYFDRCRSLAFGVAACGSGVGSFVLSVVMMESFLSASYTETLLLFAALSLNMVVAGAMCFPVYEYRDEYEYAEEENYVIDEEKLPLLEPQNTPQQKTLKLRKIAGKRRFECDLCINPVLMAFGLAGVLITMGSFSMLQLVVDYALEKGIPMNSASLLLTIAGCVEIFGRCGWGIFFNLSMVRPLQMPIFCASAVAVGLSAVIIAVSYQFWQFTVGVSIYIACYGAIKVFCIEIISQLFEEGVLASAFSIYSNMVGIGSLAGAALAGSLRQSSGSYLNSYLVMASLCFSAAFIFSVNFFAANRLRNAGRFRLRPVKLTA